MTLPPDASPFFYSPRRGAYPPPDNPVFDFFEDGMVCIMLNPRWVPFINGVLDVLRESEVWSERQDFAVNEINELQIALHGWIGSDGFCGSYDGTRFLVDDDGYALIDDDGYILVDDDQYVDPLP